MARNQKLQVDIEANDRASGKIDKVADKSDRLDKSDPKIDIEANDKASATLDDLASKLDDLGLPVGNLASKLGGKGGVAAGVVAIGAGLIVAAQNAAEVAFEAENLATLTGDSVEEASRLNAVWKQSGADSKDLQDVLLQMNGVLATNADLAATLGVNLNDGATVGQRFEQVAQALDRIPDAAKRSQIASQIFGEEGVRQYNAMRNSVDDLSSALADVPEGSVITDEEVADARKMQEQMRELTAEFESFATALGSVVVPVVGTTLTAFNDLFTGAEDVGRSIRGWFDGGEAQRNREFAGSVDAAADAARRFDTSLLDGATTYEEARKVADEYAATLDDGTDKLHAANLIVVEWNKSQQAATEAAAEAEAQSRLNTEAMRDQAKAANKTATTLGELERAAEAKAQADEDAAAAAEEHAEKVDELYQAGQRLVGGDIAVRNAQRDAAEAMAELSANATAQSVEVDAATESQLRAADAATDYEVKQREANGETVTAKERAEIYRSQLEQLADELEGPVRDAILGYIAELNNVPKSIDTWVNTNYRDVYHSEVNRDAAKAANNAATTGVPAFDDGGVVPGPTGSPQIIKAHGGETILPTHKKGGNPIVGPGVEVNIEHFHNDSPADVEAFASALNARLRI